MAGKAKKIIIFLTIFMLLLLPARNICSQNSSSSPCLRTVVIDPGHGGKDPGAPGPDSRNSEKHIVLKISKLLGEKISREYPSVKVVYTRTGDTFPKLTDRIKIAHDNKADLFISIHCNASNNKSVTGSSAHILSRKDSGNSGRDLFEENIELTKLENSVIELEEDQSSYTNTAEDQIINSLLFNANYGYSVFLAQLVVDRLACSPFRKWGKGVHQNAFHLLKKMTCPAILVETAFLSNPNERKMLVSEKWQEEIAERLFQAFKEYKTVYDASVTSSVTEPVMTGDGGQAEIPERYYGIQIMGLVRLLEKDDPNLKGLEVRAVKADDSDIYKYVYGIFGSKEKAAAELPSIRKKFPQAFIVIVSGTGVSTAK